jgi:hypothetical protein
LEPFVYLVVVVGGLWTAALSSLVSAARTPERLYEAVGRTKTGTVLCILLACGVGGLYYWLRVRPELRDAARDPHR